MAIRTRRRRRRRDHPRPTSVAIRGLIVCGIAGLIGFGLLRLYNGVPGENYATYYVSTPQVGNLLIHDPVRIAGSRVGQVRSIGIGDDGQPRLDLQLDPGTQLPVDTHVTLRANGLLGARYVSLEPGSSQQLLAQGATIHGDANSYTYGLPETLAVFNKPTREGIQQTFGNLGAGFLGNGASLNETIHDAARGPREFGDLAQTIDTERPGAVARLLPDIASAMEPLDRTRGAVGPFTQNGAQALQPFVQEREQFRNTLEQAPSALAAAESGLARGTSLLAAVRSFSTEANQTLPTAPEGLTQLSALLGGAQGPLKATQPLLNAASGAVPGALTILHSLDPAIPHIKEGLDLSRPILRYAGAEHGCELMNFGVVLRSVTGYHQAGNGPNGPLEAFRLEAVPEGSSTFGLGDPFYKRDAYTTCKYLSKPYSQYFPENLQGGFNPGSLANAIPGNPAGGAAPNTAGGASLPLPLPKVAGVPSLSLPTLGGVIKLPKLGGTP